MDASQPPPRATLPSLSAGPFLDETAEGGPRLIGSECGDCGLRMFPPAAICPGCMGEALRPLPLSRQGTLYTYSVLHVGARGWDAPYMVGYIDLPEDVRVFTHLDGFRTEDLACDIPVALRLSTPVVNAEGREVLQFKFGPVGEAG